MTHKKQPICGDCLCRVCIHNMAGAGNPDGGCEGCNNCTGIVDIPEDCVNQYGFELDEDEDGLSSKDTIK